ncbi:asparagine synthase-related protein [Phytoactinopolyspora halotolerans]|uniref:asparagine synthase (glutamine-hydrolyzing) n=1 Tax=Phytoactinopolyspora halotolerans TaxID=1981512 RepID=A0A6L9S6M8_9ACTN|nr:asparagine synthetase B family protein [Phytoactinopolyspora halotolerans]NED99649.1 hypothetical protein [Phytoactinopolyspora halotolerans]
MAVGAIAGAISRQVKLDPGVVVRMLDEVPHRGTVVQTLERGNAALGVVGDGIHSVSSLGVHGRMSCALLGPLDNVAELGRELGLHGEPLGQQDAARVVAAAFVRWGAAAAGKLRGAFACIVTDGERAWSFRDHIGGRPFFFRDDGHTWWGASEAKQVVAGAGLDRRPDLDAIATTYFRGVSSDAALKGVSRLRYGSIQTVGPHGSTEDLHWNPGPEMLETARLSVDDAVDELTEVMRRAVERTVHGADAVALSGGIDSPAVAAFAAPRHQELAGIPLHAYTYVYPHQSTVDESPYTRAVAEQLGIPLKEFEVTSGPLDELDTWVALADGPWDSLPMATAAYGYRVAAGFGATQVLTGTLAEYVFTINSFLLGHLASHGRWRALADQMSKRRAAGMGRRRLARRLVWELTPAPAGKFKAWAVRRRSNFFPLWTDMTVVGGYRYETALLNPVRKRWTTPTLQAARGTTTTSEAMEICAAAEGVTVRQPLADRDLWEWFLRLPAEVKFPDTVPKSIVRRALRGRVPDTVLDRRDKTLFDEHVMDTVPWDRLRHYLSDTDYRMPGIDYAMLLDRVDRKALRPVELIWAYDLCGVHAFVKTF